MLQYDNRGWNVVLMIFRTEGSVLWQSMFVALVPMCLSIVFHLGMVGQLGQEFQYFVTGMKGDWDGNTVVIAHPFACQVLTT